MSLDLLIYLQLKMSTLNICVMDNPMINISAGVDQNQQ